MRTALLPLLALAFASRTASAQTRADVAAERSAYDAWLAGAATSPYRAVALQPVGDGLRIGPGGDLPLDGVGTSRIAPAAGGLVLESPAGRRPLSLHRPAPLGRYTIVAGGTAGRVVVAVYDSQAAAGAPDYYAYDPTLVFTGPLLPASAPRSERLLAPDGVEVEATEAGSVLVPLGGKSTRLRVMRIPDPSTGESELEIYFRDSTNLGGTYPAGRFVSLLPAGEGRYRLDFNRARNPYCAYSSAYPCPAPWRGNSLPAAVPAGEKYKAK